MDDNRAMINNASVRICQLPILIVLVLTASSVCADEYDDARQDYQSGNYQACLDACNLALSDGVLDEKWPLLKIRALMTTGKYDEALKAVDQGLDEHENSIRLRLTGIDVCRYTNEIERSFKLALEIERLYDRSAWRYRDAVQQVAMGRFYLEQGFDAKEVLDRFFTPAKKNYPRLIDSYMAIGDLALTKNDYNLAAIHFRQALELDDWDPEICWNLAQALAPSNAEASAKQLERALEINPRHIPSLLMIADNQIDGELYADAEMTLQSILEINEHQPEAWAYRAVIAHLNNRPEKEIEHRKRALAKWRFNPNVDHLIGKKLSSKYRFKEAEAYQRRSLVFDEEFIPAQIELAQDVLRLGKEREGWELAEKVYNADNYNVVAHNLATLRDQLENYTTIKRRNFVVRMDPFEAKIYGDRVVELLSRASDILETKYKIDIKTPVIVEIFSRQQDFAIRTFGTPGGDGFLGVCFGNVVTMNSPAAQGSHLTSWESVLWHEFCHVVTLQKTKNKMPRWLSEGISVYEEGLANSAWGQSMNTTYYEMINAGELTPVSKLSNAFLKPESAKHLQFAYYQSSLVVRYLVENKGLDVLVNILEDLKVGMPINESISRYVGSMKLFEKEFEQYAKELANELVAKADWSKPDLDDPNNLKTIDRFLAKNPNNVAALHLKATLLVTEKKWDSAKKVCQQLLDANFNFPGETNPHLMLAGIYQVESDLVNEKKAIRNYLAVDLNSLEPIQRLIEIYRQEDDWESVIDACNYFIAVNPMIALPHRYLVEAAEKLNKHDEMISSLSALMTMDPIDPAKLHFQLAKAYFAKGQVSLAKRSVLQSIEEAPRYREAHQLLIEIKKQESNAQSIQSNTSKANDRNSRK